MNKKPLLLFQGPARSRSGYGDHTRDLILSLINMDKFDIKIAPTRWGDCPETGLAGNPDRSTLEALFMVDNKLQSRPDVFINCSVPNEFQPVGKYNIGITAGIETTLCDPTWIEGCNRMDLIIVPSHHSKNVFINTKFDKMDNDSKQKVGELKIETPIEVLFEGVDLEIYKQLPTPQPSINEELKSIKEDFCFLYVGHWLDGALGHDRKDTGMLIKTFCKAFSEKKTKPALILKTSSATFSVLDRRRMLSKINDITSEFGTKCPSIYLLHGDLTPEEMNGLYNHPKVKAHVSFTKGEGFGRPLLEASVSGKPVIASDWSGQLDFLHKDMSTLLPGELKEVHKSARWKGVINEGTHWFYVNYQIAEKILRDVHRSYKSYLPGARKQAHYTRTNFSIDKMTELFSNIVNTHVKSAPQQVALTLPTLKKVDKVTPTINLPKLKKV
tara:strand:+ start:13057 stop:14382 length:1326 start_codon:yes stop_codon:yes gene_type:complete